MEQRSDSSRFTRRQWVRRLRSARPWLLTVAMVGLVALAGWAVFFSSWLATEQVDVGGTEIVSSDEVRKVAAIDMGTPLVRVDLDAARDRIEDLPAVDSATVHRSWPHTIEITRHGAGPAGRGAAPRRVVRDGRRGRALPTDTGARRRASGRRSGAPR